MKRIHAREAIVILFDKNLQRPISACVGSHMVGDDRHFRRLGKVRRHSSEPLPTAQLSVLPSDYVQKYLDKIPLPDVLPPARTVSAPNVLPIPFTGFAPPPVAAPDVRNFPPKFQIWAKTRAREQIPIGQQGPGP
jgi:hypothetical protein